MTGRSALSGNRKPLFLFGLPFSLARPRRGSAVNNL